MGSTGKPEQKCSRFSQHTSSELPLGHPRAKSVLSQQQSHGPARLEPALQSTASSRPRPAPALLPVPPSQHPHGRQPQGSTRGQEPGALALAATRFWPHLCPPTCCWRSPRSSTSLLGTYGHEEEEESKAGRGRGPPHSCHAATTTAAATASAAGRHRTPGAHAEHCELTAPGGAL